MNEAAWEASKALLIPCNNCGRKFAPDRLPVHLKSCKEPAGGKAMNQSKSDTGSMKSEVGLNLT